PVSYRLSAAQRSGLWRWSKNDTVLACARCGRVRVERCRRRARFDDRGALARGESVGLLLGTPVASSRSRGGNKRAARGALCAHAVSPVSPPKRRDKLTVCAGNEWSRVHVVVESPSTTRLLAFARELQRARTFQDLIAAAHAEVTAALGYEHVW